MTWITWLSLRKGIVQKAKVPGILILAKKECVKYISTCPHFKIETLKCVSDNYLGPVQIWM